MTDAPVGRLIEALLDTGTTGWAGADATGGLLAAPRGPHGAPTIEAKCANQPAPRDFLLRRAMSFYVRYLTCSTHSRGYVLFFPDLYHPDEALRRVFFAPVPKPVATENREQ